ncbi:MAG TPA: response regulator [Bacteroidota bacterium]|nr:response regulator [Bacteroidota bacterium]
MEKNALKVLLIDDDVDYVEVVRHYLHPFQNWEFDVISANNQEQALRVLGGNHLVDVILMDYFLPGTNGVEIAKKIRESNIDVPMILLTSNRDFRIAIEAMKYGIVEYLIKEEVVDSILPRAIVNIVDRHRLGSRIAAAEKQKLYSEKNAETVQELVVTLCHEFNNPLAAIKISADIILRQKISDEERAILTKLNQNIAQLEKQIVKLRDLSADKPQPGAQTSASAGA